MSIIKQKERTNGSKYIILIIQPILTKQTNILVNACVEYEKEFSA